MSAATESAVVEGLDFMGIKINEDKNAARGTVDISADDANSHKLLLSLQTKNL